MDWGPQTRRPLVSAEFQCYELQRAIIEARAAWLSAPEGCWNCASVGCWNSRDAGHRGPRPTRHRAAGGELKRRPPNSTNPGELTWRRWRGGRWPQGAGALRQRGTLEVAGCAVARWWRRRGAAAGGSDITWAACSLGPRGGPARGAWDCANTGAGGAAGRGRVLGMSGVFQL